MVENNKNIQSYIDSLKEPMDQQLLQEQKDHFDEHLPPTLSSKVSQFEQLNLKYSYSGISNASSSNDIMLITTRSFNDQAIKLTFIQSSQLFQTINRLALQLQKRMMIDHQLVLYLLYLFRWNQEKLNEVYYDKLVEEFVVMDSRVRNHNRQMEDYFIKGQEQSYGTCEICYNQSVRLYSSCFCQHQYCKSCWTSYMKQNLTNNHIFFPCMSTECTKHPILLQFVQSVAPQLMDLYKKKICVNYAILNKSISYCPCQKCEYFCEKPLMVEQNYIQCPCGRVYCFKCEKEPHEPACCQEVEKWEKITNEEKNNELWIEKYTRKCPTCKQPVEKYVGCDHVKCVCGAQFCFNCNALWDQRHKSSSQCIVPKQKPTLSQQNLFPSTLQPLTDKLIYISRSINQDMATIKHTMQLLAKEQPLLYLKELFQDIKSRVHHAWTNIKWTMVALFLREKTQIEIEIEKDSIQSIQKLMQTVDKIQKKISAYDTMSLSHMLYMESKELLHLKEELFKRKETMVKTMEVWSEAWRFNIGDY